MPRRARIVAGNHVYHVLNRANGHEVLFESAACYREFLHIFAEAGEETEMRILAYCAMPNHWHMLLWPREKEDLRRFVQRLTIRHSHRWHVRKGTVGRGALYQGRHKSFIVQTDRHLLTVCRYVERNPLRAGLVESSLAWPWSSAPDRARALGVERACLAQSNGPRIALTTLPTELPNDWVRWLDEPQTAAEIDRLRVHVQGGAPYGDAKWLERMGQRTAERPINETPRDQAKEVARLESGATAATGKRYK